MKYEVGDKVKVKTGLRGGNVYARETDGGVHFNERMEEYCGLTTIITYADRGGNYALACDRGKWNWSIGMLEPVGEEPITTPNTLTIDMDKLSDKDKELVKSIVDKSKNPFDIPTEEHTYYYINTVGRVVAELWQNTDGDDTRYFLGNYFLTKECAEFEVNKREILRKLEILSQKAGGVDWEDTDTTKYSMRYNHYDGELRIFEAYAVRCIDRIYFPTEESLQEAINLIGESNIKKYIFGVEE